jgi:MinD-like ATPase involved in chromosome partitioning or flagellar assembly
VTQAKIFKFDFVLFFMGKIIGVVSLKGGVGKTSTVVELGAAIAGFGKKVLLVDGNLSSPNLGLRFGIVDPEKTLHHVLQRSAHARDAVYELSENVHLMPSSLFFRGEVNAFKLKEHLRMLRRGYDYIIIDSSPSLDSETLAVMLASDNILVVTTPDHVTLGTTIKAVKRAKQRGAPIGGLVLNKVHDKDFELSLPEIEDVLEIPVLAVVRHNLDMLGAVAGFTSLVDTVPNSNESHEFKKLAATLIGEKYKPKRLKNLFHFNPKREEINREIYYERVFG